MEDAQQFDPEASFVHDTRFVEPFANRPHEVLGRRLFPYSLWTHCLLEWAQSPFLLNNREPTMHDLWVAVQFASAPWGPEHYVPDVAIRSRLFWSMKMSRFNFKLELAKFVSYLNDFAVGPKFWPNQHKGGQVENERDCDENLEAATFLEYRYGLSPRDVWTMPLGQLRWRVAMAGKFEGSDTPFWTPVDEEKFQEHKKQREAKIDARGKEIHAENPSMTAEEARKKANDEYWARVRENLSQTQNSMPTPPRAE